MSDTLDEVWSVPRAWTDAVRVPGWVGAVRIAGRTVVACGGRRGLDPTEPPMDPGTLFRIASVTKPIAGALALSLVRDGVVALDDPIARWMPELASPRVLLDPDGPLDETVPAERPVTVRHLLTGTAGWGVRMEDTPRQRAMIERGVGPGALPPAVPPDDYVAGIAEVPLAFQPGAGWLYHSPMELLGVLLARAADRPLDELMAARVTGPLGMTDTAFHAVDPSRLATAYGPGPDGLALLDPPDGVAAAPPVFPSLAGGLISTAGDVARFVTAIADGGAPVLGPEDAAALHTDALDAAQHRSAAGFLGPGRSWGLGAGVDVETGDPPIRSGRWGWDGGTGTTAWVDPTHDTVAVLLTQRAMTGPHDGFDAFHAAVAAAADGAP